LGRGRSVIVWHDFGRRNVNGVSRWILELSKKYEIYAIPGGFGVYGGAIGKRFRS